MAEFNVKPQAQLPNSYVGLSEGIRADRPQGVGMLFEGLAHALDSGVKEADRNVKANIEKDIFDEVDAVQGEFGVPDATDMQADADEKSFRTGPIGVQRANEQLQRLQLAYEQGNLKESHYWARMNNMVRQLRGKYPGYRSEIDQMVASVTGARPANALRAALFDEWRAEASKESSLSKLEDWAIKNGRLPVDYYQRKQENNPYTQTELAAYVARKQRDEAERSDRRAALAENAERGTATTKDVEKAFRTEASQTVTTILQDATSTAGADYRQITAKIQEAQRAVANGNPLPAQDVEQLRGLMGELKTTIRNTLHQHFIESWDGNPEHSYMTQLDKKTMDDAIEQAMTPVSVLEQALSSDQPWGVLGSVSAILEAQKNDASRELLRDYPLMSEMKAMSDALGSQAFSQFLSLSPSLQKATDKVMVTWGNIMMGRATQTGQTISDTFEDFEKKDASPEVYNGVIDQWTKLADQVSEKKVPLSVVQSGVDYMFGPGSDRVMAQMDDASRFTYFKKVASPTVSRQMMQLRDQGDVTSWQKYQRWVANSFQILFAQKVQDLQGFVTQPDAFDVQFDPKQNRFKVRVNVIGNRPAEAEYWSKRSTEYISQLNDAIQVVAPIIKANEGDTGMEILNLLSQMGYDPSAAKTPESGSRSFLNKLTRAVGAGLASLNPDDHMKAQISHFLFGDAADGKSLYDALQQEPVVSKYGRSK